MGSHEATGVDAVDQAQLQHDIEVARAHLGHTVEQLGQKLDVKRQARLHRDQLMVAGAVVAAAVVLLVWRRGR